LGHFFNLCNFLIFVKTIFFKNPFLEQNGDSRRTPRVDSDTEDQENDEIEIDEHSSVSTNENSDDVQIEEETVNIRNGEKRRQNGQEQMVSD
jgi:hypothetical protein